MPWLIAIGEAGRLLGYAYAAPFHVRAAYRWVAQTTIYLDPAAQGQGLGRTLYAALLDALAAQRLVAATAMITLPNAASVRLHERLGFAAIGRHRQVGYKFGQWHDVGLWQKELAARVAEPEEPARP